MIDRGRPDLGALSMRELLRLEAENQTRVMIDNLLEIEKGALTDKELESLMRAAHSIKGGARIASLAPVVELAHALEDLFVAARAGKVELKRDQQVEALLQAVDLLGELAQAGAEREEVGEDLRQRAAAMRETVLAIVAGSPSAPVAEATERRREERRSNPPPAPVAETAEPAAGKRPERDPAGRTVKVGVERMDRLMALVGELSVKDKLAEGLRTEALRARRHLHEIRIGMDGLRSHLAETNAAADWVATIDALASKAGQVAEFLAQGVGRLEIDAVRTANIAGAMRREVISHRMQPFGDATQGFRRLVRRLEQELGKQVSIEFSGEAVGVDRDILERLNAPLTHLIQNAVDHGLERPEARAALGKPPTGRVSLSAQHRGGLLCIVVEDDGRGIDLERVRQTALERKLVSEAVAASLQEHELIDFLFLPNFTLSEQVSEISGRGVGLDVVRNMLRQVRGGIRVLTRAGQGTRFEITLPVTLIVVRCLLVEVAGEQYALPLARVVSARQAALSDVQCMENRQYLILDGCRTGLVGAADLLEVPATPRDSDTLSVVVFAKGVARYGLVVDRMLGERQVVEKPLDPRLGKIEDVSSMALLDDGSVVLILDIDDLLHSIERLASGQPLRRIGRAGEQEALAGRKRVLVVDDSITVREVERGMLAHRGFEVDVAVDGADGWNALRTHKYDLVVSDVDMPRMDGIELVKLIRADGKLNALPVIVVSYKDREEDRLRGLDAGADRYLTKGSFQDDTFLDTVQELIGPPDAE